MKFFRNLNVLALSALTLLAGFQACVEVEDVQDESTSLSVEVAYQAVSAEATTAEFQVSSNASWKVTGDSDWITGFTQSGTGDGVITVTFPANESATEERAAAFAVTAGKKAVAITVTQARKGADVSAAQLSATKLSLEVDAEVTEVEFDIKSNTIWGVYSEADWLRGFTLYGEGNGKLKAQFDINKNRKKSRTAEFIVSARDATINLTLTQKKTDKVYLIDATASQFSGYDEDEDIYYRVSGLIEEIVDAAAGIIKVKDATGVVVSDKLRSSLDAAESSFVTLGAKVGDYISIVGVRSSKNGDPVMADCYVDVTKAVKSVHISQYSTLPDGDADWIYVRGLVTEILDPEQGKLTLRNPWGDETININSCLDGVGGQPGRFQSLDVSVNDLLTVIIPAKNGNNVDVAYFSGRMAGKYGEANLASWSFTKEKIDISHWVDGTVDDQKSVQLTTPGLSDHYIPSLDQKGKIYYYVADRSGTEIQWPSITIFNTGQPGFDQIWVDDAFEFHINNQKLIPEGNEVRLTMVMRLVTACVGVYALEYYADGQWHMGQSASTPIKTVKVGGKEYAFNVQRTGNNTETLQTPSFVLRHDIPAGELKFRLRAAAPYSCGQAEMTAGGGKSRFRGGSNSKWGNVDCGPFVDVL